MLTLILLDLEGLRFFLSHPKIRDAINRLDFRNLDSWIVNALLIGHSGFVSAFAEIGVALQSFHPVELLIAGEKSPRESLEIFDLPLGFEPTKEQWETLWLLAKSKGKNKMAKKIATLGNVDIPSLRKKVKKGNAL